MILIVPTLQIAIERIMGCPVVCNSGVNLIELLISLWKVSWEFNSLECIFFSFNFQETSRFFSLNVARPFGIFRSCDYFSGKFNILVAIMIGKLKVLIQSQHKLSEGSNVVSRIYIAIFTGIYCYWLGEVSQVNSAIKKEKIDE